jgi:hypothetical protein
MTWNVSDYLKTVTAIAEEAIAEHPGDTSGPAAQVNEIWASVIDDERREYVSQSVDGSEFVIYYGANDTVLEATDNEPDGAEVRALSAKDADWRTMRTLAAYLAMEADVLAEVERLTAAQRVA